MGRLFGGDKAQRDVRTHNLIIREAIDHVRDGGWYTYTISTVAESVARAAAADDLTEIQKKISDAKADVYCEQNDTACCSGCGGVSTRVYIYTDRSPQPWKRKRDKSHMS